MVNEYQHLLGANLQWISVQSRGGSKTHLLNTTETGSEEDLSLHSYIIKVLNINYYINHIYYYIFLFPCWWYNFTFTGEMIDKLTLTFNRTRQAVITRELVEIISGAAALDWSVCIGLVLLAELLYLIYCPTNLWWINSSIITESNVIPDFLMIACCI